MQQKIIVEITVDWEDYQDVDPELIFEDTGMPSAAKEGVTYKVITPPSSHQGEVVKDSGIWNEAIEAGRKYQSQVGRLGGDKETCIAVYADGYIDGQLSQPAPPTPVEGQWHLKSHNNSEDDDTVWMTDGKLSIYIDEFNFGDFPEADYWLVNFLNKYQFKLSIDDQSPLIISHLEEQVKELQGRPVWVRADQLNPKPGGLQFFKFDNKLDFKSAGRGFFNDNSFDGDVDGFPENEYPFLWILSDSPAPEQVDVDSMLSDAINKAKAFSESIPDGEDKQLAHHAFILGYAANVNGPNFREAINHIRGLCSLLQSGTSDQTAIGNALSFIESL